jgi:hypothetical protein
MKELQSWFKIWNGPSERAQAICHARRLCALALLVAVQGRAEVTVTSPGLAPSRMDDQGRLVEDWGALSVTVSGAGLPATAPVTVQGIKLDGRVPAAQATSQQGTVALTLTTFRA